MSPRKSVLALLLCGLFLSACTLGLPRGPGEAESSFAIDDSRLDLQPHLGLAIERLDWRLVPYDSSDVEGADADLAKRARYRLEDSSTRVRNCTAASGLYAYRLRVVENQTGEIVLELSGTGCETAVAERLERFMQRAELVPR